MKLASKVNAILPAISATVRAGSIVVKQAVELSGGQVLIESSLGKGTTAIVTLPVTIVDE